MAVRYPASSLSACLSQEDLEWLAEFARHEDVSVPALVSEAVWHFRYWQEKGKKAIAEVLKLIDLADRDYERQVRRRHYFQREYESQSRRLHNMRRAYEKQLRQERSLRSAYEKQLRRQHDYYERQSGVAEAFRDALYGPTVATLLALAICSESDGEAKAAFAKARALYRKEALSCRAEVGPASSSTWRRSGR